MFAPAKMIVSSIYFGLESDRSPMSASMSFTDRLMTCFELFHPILLFENHQRLLFSFHYLHDFLNSVSLSKELTDSLIINFNLSS